MNGRWKRNWSAAKVVFGDSSSGPVLANEAVMYAVDPEWNIGPRESVSLRLPAFEYPGVFGPLTPDVDSDFFGAAR